MGRHVHSALTEDEKDIASTRDRRERERDAGVVASNERAHRSRTGERVRRLGRASVAGVNSSGSSRVLPRSRLPKRVALRRLVRRPMLIVFRSRDDVYTARPRGSLSCVLYSRTSFESSSAENLSASKSPGGQH